MQENVLRVRVGQPRPLDLGLAHQDESALVRHARSLRQPGRRLVVVQTTQAAGSARLLDGRHHRLLPVRQLRARLCPQQTGNGPFHTNNSPHPLNQYHNCLIHIFFMVKLYKY